MAYDAFISYSHAADGRLAPAIQSALHRFAKPWWKLHAAKVFRDETSLSASHDLTESIKSALVQSRFFILLASPGAAQSEWVGREVGLWIERKARENILIVLTEGSIVWDQAGDFDWSRTDALPKALAGVFRAEPLWVDLSWARKTEQLSMSDPRFQQAIARIAAPLHGKSLDEITGEEVRQHRKTRRLVQAAVASITLLAAAAGVAAWLAREAQLRAEANLKQALIAVNDIETAVAKDLQDLVGVPLVLRMKMLSAAEKVLTNLGTTDQSSAVRSTRAVMLSEFASAYGALGSYADATTRVREAMTILADLEKGHPHDVAIRATHAKARKVYGEVLWWQRKDLDTAIEQLQGSADGYAQLVSSHPGHPDADDWQLQRFRALVEIGDVYYDGSAKRGGVCGEPRDCLSNANGYFSRASDLAGSMQDHDGPDLHWKNGLLVSRERLAKVYEAQGDLAQAGKIYAELLVEFTRMAERQPDNSKWQENLIAIFWRNAGVQDKNRRSDLALADYMKALGIARRLHQSQPDLLDWTRELSMSLIFVGRAHAALGQIPLAQQEYCEGLKLTEELVNKQPANQDVKQNAQEIRQGLAQLGEGGVSCTAPSAQ